MDVKEIEFRLKSAKSFLRSEMTHLKAHDGQAQMTLQEVGYLQDSIHEVERRGIRNLNDMDFIKIRRILTSVESKMKIHLN